MTPSLVEPYLNQSMHSVEICRCHLPASHLHISYHMSYMMWMWSAQRWDSQCSHCTDGLCCHATTNPLRSYSHPHNHITTTTNKCAYNISKTYINIYWSWWEKTRPNIRYYIHMNTYIWLLVTRVVIIITWVWYVCVFVICTQCIWLLFL